MNLNEIIVADFRIDFCRSLDGPVWIQYESSAFGVLAFPFSHNMHDHAKYLMDHQIASSGHAYYDNLLGGEEWCKAAKLKNLTLNSSSFADYVLPNFFTISSNGWQLGYCFYVSAHLVGLILIGGRREGE